MKIRGWTIAAILCVGATGARADLFVVVGKDGVRSIVSKRKPGAKTLWKEKARRPASAKKTVQRGARKARGPEPLSARVRAKRYASIVREAAAYHSLPEALVWAVMRVESHFQPNVVSHKGAQGLMQLMPDTAAEVGVKDAFDPRQNIFGGVRYLRILANRFGGDVVKMVAGYHAGGGAVNRAGGVPYQETAEYLRRVLNAYYKYKVTPPTETP
ncbi:MAG: lytic transglycosylase domain-containing protein [Myxococcota bacterium]|nr:lytic transglycosylase domain-containing protein [Myxococcota bacterium]